jgi:glycosyltransferase involved in cell wall biosynthesis
LGKIVIISHYAPSLVNFRGDLMKALVHQGHEVICLAPEEGYESHLKEIGASYQRIPLKRTGLNPLKDVYTLFILRRVLKELKPDIVLSYAVKPIVYGSIAAHMAGVKQIYAMVTGLGYVFVGQSIKQKILTQLVSYLYRTGLKYNRVVFFQNPDDLQLFIEKRIMPKNVKPVLINGSGVNTERFGFASPKLSPITFLLIARMIRDKGILEYVEAARQLKKRYSEVRIQLLGPLDVNPAAITRKEIKHWGEEGIIEYLGETKDVRPYIAEASVFVLPSYREGTPRSVLEAMSMGRPIITTDAPGCRETTQEGVNGYLVPVKDYVALFKAMERFILQPELIPVFGLASRRIAEKKYDVHKVNHIILEEMGLLENTLKVPGWGKSNHPEG